MAKTWSLVNKASGNTEHSSTRYNYPPTAVAPEGMIWSYFDFFSRGNCPYPALSYKYGSAIGEAKPDEKGCIRFEIQGIDPKDINVVIAELEKSIGCVSLKPTLTLPDGLETPKERFMYLVHLIFSKK